MPFYGFIYKATPSFFMFSVHPSFQILPTFQENKHKHDNNTKLFNEFYSYVIKLSLQLFDVSFEKHMSDTHDTECIYN